MRCTAIGDTCLLHIRANQVLRCFPVEQVEQFQADPLVIGSIDLSHDALLQFAVMEESCEDGDLLALCTDAVAEWALRRMAAGTPPDWESYWHITEESWQDEVVHLRQLREMRYDDATLILLRVSVPQSVRPSQPAAASSPPVDPLPTPASTEIYALQDDVAPPCDAAASPPPATGAGPPPLPPMDGMENSPLAPVLERAKTMLAASEDVAEKVAGGLLRGMQKAEKFLRKYRGKYPPKEKDEGKE